MVFGEVLSKFYSKHTSGINLGNLKEQLEQTYEHIPIIKNRINILQRIEVTNELKIEVETRMGKTAAKYIEEQTPPINQWALYNILTYYVSHLVEQRMRASYQMKVSKLFKL